MSTIEQEKLANGPDNFVHLKNEADDQLGISQTCQTPADGSNGEYVFFHSHALFPACLHDERFAILLLNKNQIKLIKNGYIQKQSNDLSRFS